MSSGDKVLLNKRIEQGCVSILLEVNNVSGNKVNFSKLLEVKNGVNIGAFSEAGNFESEELLEISQQMFTQIYERLISELKINTNKDEDHSDIPRVTGGENILLYGVPGVGKSHTIQKDYCSDQSRMETQIGMRIHLWE